jgi:hypothetical protein
MTQNRTARRVALSLLLSGIALPAAAQDAQTVTPPTVTPAPAPAEPATPPPAPAASPSITFAPQSPVVQAVPPPPAPPAEASPTETGGTPSVATQRHATRSSVSRTSSTTPTTTRTAQAPTAAQVAPAPSTASAPAEALAPAPSPTATAAAAPEAAAPVNPAPVAAEPAPVAKTSDTLLWAPIAIGGLIILGLLAYLFSRRRRADETVYQEEAYYTPVEETPVAAAPAAFVSAPEAVAAPVTAAEETSRPWIDIGLRPIRAESDGALQVELTVSNSGEAEAHDVRVSTWMLNSADSSEGEQALIEARSSAQVATVHVAPGEDESVDTRVPFPAEAGTPLLVAEARYPLPQGGEGRIAATFEIDVKDRDVEARLHDVLERA